MELCTCLVTQAVDFTAPCGHSFPCSAMSVPRVWSLPHLNSPEHHSPVSCEGCGGRNKAAQIWGLEENQSLRLLYPDFQLILFSSPNSIPASKNPMPPSFEPCAGSTILGHTDTQVLISQNYRVSSYFSIYFPSSRKFLTSMLHCYFPFCALS